MPLDEAGALKLWQCDVAGSLAFDKNRKKLDARSSPWPGLG